MAALLDVETKSEQLAPLLASFPHSTGSTGHLGVGSILAEKYRLDSLLGAGAMGAVWQATNLLLDAPVAIKLAHAELTSSAFRARLQLEARAAASFVHPGIVRVFDVGDTDAGDPFIVMELLQGATLAQMASQGPLDAVRVVQILLPIIDALAAMHARGVVHRDLKPDNLFVALEGQRVQPKILDFGIAISSDPQGGPLAIHDGGVLVGSPEYMSPEQAAASDDIDHRSDIWSICVVLYEAVAGDTPFNASHAMLLLRAITLDDPISLVDHGVADQPLWEIVRVGLSKDRESRHASMSELGRKLARWLLDRDVHDDVCGTSLASTWLAGDSGIAGGVNALEATPHHHAEPVPLVRTTPPRGARAAKKQRSARRHVGAARPSRIMRAAKACTLVGAMGLAFFARPPKNAVSALLTSRTWVEHHVVDPIAWSPLSLHQRAQCDEASTENHPDVLTPNARPDQGTIGPEHSSPNAPRRGQVARQNVPLRKSLRAIDRVELDLLEPY